MIILIYQNGNILIIIFYVHNLITCCSMIINIHISYDFNLFYYPIKV